MLSGCKWVALLAASDAISQHRNHQPPPLPPSNPTCFPRPPCPPAESAYFWADGSNTSAITGHWLDIAREVKHGGWLLKQTLAAFLHCAPAVQFQIAKNILNVAAPLAWYSEVQVCTPHQPWSVSLAHKCMTTHVLAW